MTLSLGIDIGTSGIRTAILDETGSLVSMARAAHVPQSGDQIDASHWWTAVQTCIRNQVEALEALGKRGADITAIAVDGTSGTMVLTDAALLPVGPALMYNSSGFSGEAHLISDAGAPADHITQGQNSALGRAMRLVSLSDGSARHLLHQADFVAAKLMGRGGLSDHNNALKTGFDPETEDWPDWISGLIDPKLLPEVLAVGTAFGAISPDVARDLGVSAHAQIFAGTTDSVAAFLAAADPEPGAAVTSIGSTLALKLASTARIDLPSQGLYSHRIGDIWLAGGASNTGGAVLAHFFSTDELVSLSAQINPEKASAHDYYPLLKPGERFPTNDPQLPPRMDPRPADDAEFLHGLFEGIARIEADGYRLIEKAGGKFPGRVLTCGGAAQNKVFARLRARVLGAEIAEAEHTEAAIGSARICQMFQ